MQGVCLCCVRLCSHTVSLFKFFRDFLCSFHIFFLALPFKAVSPWVGLCFQDILVWCAYGNASWRHHRHDIKKGRLRNVNLLCSESGKFRTLCKKIAQSERPRGWFYITTATFYIVIYNRCCTRIYYLMTWANWLLILRYRFTRARRWDKRRVQHPRLFHSLKIYY